jgi:fatty acid desaturase
MDVLLDQSAVARRLLSPKDHRLKALLIRQPWRASWDIARCYGLISLAFLLLANCEFWWISFISFAVIGTQQYALFILGHDGIHSNLLYRREANDILTTTVLFAPLGTRVRSARTAHLAHHRLLGTAEDPDRKLHIASNKATRGRFLFFLTGLATVPEALLRILPFAKNKTHDQAPNRTNSLAALVARWPVVVAQAAIFIGLALTFTWWTYFVFWVLPVYLMVFLPDEIRAFCEHTQPILPDSAADGRRLITFVPNIFERILFSPMNMNYHAEHHLWQFIPYYNLPEVHRLIADCDEIEIRTSYVGFLWSYFRALPLRYVSLATGK